MVLKNLLAFNVLIKCFFPNRSCYVLNMFHREKTSSIYLFKVSGFMSLQLMISVPTTDKKCWQLRDCYFCTYYWDQSLAYL